MSQLPALGELDTETAALKELAPRINGFPLEPRCRCAATTRCGEGQRSPERRR